MSFNEDFIFDSRTVPERTAFLEEGEYDCIIVNSEVKSVATGRLVEVSVEVEGKLMKMGMWIEHSNEKAVLIGCQNLRDCFVSAFGADKQAKISELINKQARVGLEKGPIKDGKQYLEIKRWLPRKSGSPVVQKKITEPKYLTVEEDVPF
jgi:hypothetical protein